MNCSNNAKAILSNKSSKSFIYTAEIDILFFWNRKLNFEKSMIISTSSLETSCRYTIVKERSEERKNR